MVLFCMQCQGIKPDLVARGKSHGFSRVASGTWDIFSHHGGDGPSKVVYVATSGLLSICEEQLAILLEAWKHNRDPCQKELVAQVPFLPATGILGFLSIFKRSQPSSNFESFICR